MIIKYRITSREKEDFVRDIEILSDNNFFDLHKAIQVACNYDSSMLSTFYLCNNNWDKLHEIAETIIDEETQEETLIMKDTKLTFFEPFKGQRFIYIFDFFSVRSFFVEIVNIRKKKKDDANLEFPICTVSKGKAPKQIFIDDSIEGILNDDNKEPEDLFDDTDSFDFDNIDDYNI